MNKRGSGILLHITSLPSAYGIGDLGPEAFAFADFLCAAGQCYWQVLPVNPTDPDRDFSPYSSTSALASNPLLISPEQLLHDGLVTAADVGAPVFPHGYIDFNRVIAYKTDLLRAACRRPRTREVQGAYEWFCEANRWWLDDHALYRVLREKFGNKPWSQWPQPLREHDKSALDEARATWHDQLDSERFVQFLFDRQWTRLKDHCHRRGVQIIGDMPIYVSYGSADVWASRGLFKLGADLQPAALAGVPPDKFSPTGQFWSDPVYDWEAMRDDRYRFWVRRFERMFSLFDIVRIDHFRGFVAYWEIPQGSEDASAGAWKEVPTDDLFNILFKHFYCFPVIAEDLGLITADVREVMNRSGFPGMKVLVFAFDNDDPLHPYRPHMYSRNVVACTGTHDTNTVCGWFCDEAGDAERARVFHYLGEVVPASQVHHRMMRLLSMSNADMVLFPLQDVLGLGTESRMNYPGRRGANWRWRFRREMLGDQIARQMRDMAETYGRI